MAITMVFLYKQTCPIYHAVNSRRAYWSTSQFVATMGPAIFDTADGMLRFSCV